MDPDFDPSDITTPVLRMFVSGDTVMAKAEDLTYLGKLTEAEAKQLTTKAVTLTRWTDMLVDMVAQDSRFGYESKAEVMRHAIEMLMEYYREQNMFLDDHKGFANEVLRRQHALRQDAERSRQRKNLREDVAAFDDEMSFAITLSDWPHIARRLVQFRDLLRLCTTETERQTVRDTLAGSTTLKAAVLAFWRWTHNDFRPPSDAWDDEWPDMAQMWVDWYADMEAALKGIRAASGTQTGRQTHGAQQPTDTTPLLPTDTDGFSVIESPDTDDLGVDPD